MGSLVIILILILTITSTFFVVPIVSSCTKTPYPKICNRYIPKNLLSNLDVDQGLAFRDVAIKVTMDQTLEAHRLVSSAINLNSFYNEKAKSAWDDCLELFEDTIDNLNRSMSSKNELDIVTWLSASIANQQTCLNGFNDLNIPNSHLQSSHPNFYQLSIDLPMLLSNSLALHKASSSFSSSYSSSSSNMHFSKQVRGRRLLIDSDDTFPGWVLGSDRKLLQSGAGSKGADIVVAQDGSGNYMTISEAILAAEKSATGTKRVVIYVKKGVYKENVEVKKTVKNLMFVGDGMDATIVTGNKNAQDGSTTFGSATFAVSGEGFIAQDMTFENTAGPQKYQAVALRSGADHSVFYRCSFKGYQDTLYVYSQRQFYRDCNIYGTVDFIFGDASAVLQNCNIFARKPMSNQINTLTAQSRTDPNENTGIIIHNCRVTAAPELGGGGGSVRTYLGRPWQKYSRVVVMKSNLDGLIAPQGWYPWSGGFGLNTLYYGEYMNTGAGAATGGRVKWPGFRVITSAAEAGKFTVGNFLAGDAWLPGTGVPFSAGL